MSDILKKIEKINIAVFGDIMLDEYVIGSVERISPEAPVPILKLEEKKYFLGGCGNVVKNIIDVGVKNVTCFSEIGHDASGIAIEKQLKKNNVRSILFKTSKPTIKKTRYVSKDLHQQLLRVDTEDFSNYKYLSYDNYKDIIENYDFSKFNFIIISEYNKGFLNRELIEFLSTFRKKLIIDPKSTGFTIFGKCHTCLPNNKEYDEISVLHPSFLENSYFILKTLGKDGMELINKNNTVLIKNTPAEIFNVTGAGDSATAIYTICLSLGYDPLFSAKVANSCANHVVTKKFTSTVSKDFFLEMLYNS